MTKSHCMNISLRYSSDGGNAWTSINSVDSWLENYRY